MYLKAAKHATVDLSVITERSEYETGIMSTQMSCQDNIMCSYREFQNPFKSIEDAPLVTVSLPFTSDQSYNE